ncbi:MAG: restriction endonuclease subunit S [Hydrogenophaga sp.]|jgi:type I restriction enzyme S subunit|nr:restriction endonuclease subunit S [Hydrogenophaga sp.]
MELNEPSAKYLVQGGLQQTEIGPIPLDWQVEPLAKVAEIRSGIAKNVNAVIADAIEVPYLRVANVQDGYLDLQEISTIRINREDLRRYSVLPFDVLMNEGGDIDKLGRGALWRGQIQPCVHQNHVFVVRCKPALAPQFLSAWSASPPARRYFLFAGKQTTNLASINKTSLGQLPVAMPRLREEQERIAQALADADALIASLEQLLSKKRQIKQGAMQELLTGQRRLPGFSDGWTPAKLEDLADIRSGGTPSTQKDEFWDGDILWCTPTDITALNGSKYLADTHRKITAMGMKACSADLIPANSIVMTSRATIGECAINVTPLCTNQGFKNFVPFSHVDAQFLYYVLTTQKAGFISLCGGSTFLEIGKTQLRPYEVSMPPTKDEQTAIATVLSDMDAEITALEGRLSKARQLKQGMAQALLTGRIRLV